MAVKHGKFPIRKKDTVGFQIDGRVVCKRCAKKLEGVVPEDFIADRLTDVAPLRCEACAAKL